MSGFEVAIWIYLVIGLVVFVVEFRQYDDWRKWIALPIPLLFITFCGRGCCWQMLLIGPGKLAALDRDGLLFSRELYLVIRAAKKVLGIKSIA